MKTIQEIAKAIQESGLKVTPQRISVIQSLEKLDHPRAEDIFREVSQQIPGLSPATVYNTLEALVRKKIIKKVHTEADVMRYDAVPEHHHHLYCMQSDRMDDYFDPELDQLLNDFFEKKNINGFKLKEVKLQLMGEFDPGS
jgi:Fur family transcriptional regulator, peroxide stress response regulator